MTISVFVLVLAATAFATDTGRKDSYVFRDVDVTWMLGEGMPADALRHIQSRNGVAFLWARRTGHTFVTRDDVTLDRVRAIVARKVTRLEQERMVAAALDDAIRRGVARPAR
jgi:hypothetical protein